MERYGQIYDIKHIEFDEILLNIGYCIENWHKCRKIAYERVESLMKEEIKNKNCPSKTVIIIDDNFQYKSMRRVYIKLCEKYSFGLCVLYFESSVENSLLQNNKRESHVTSESIVKVANELEIPKTYEFGDNINNGIILTVENCQLTEKVISETLEFCFKHRFVDAGHDNRNFKHKNQDQTLKHEVDVLSRKILGRVMKAARETKPTDILKQIASRATCKRKQFLSSIKDIENEAEAKDLLIEFESAVKALIG